MNDKFRKVNFQQDDSKKPYSIQKSGSTIALTLVQKNGDITGLPYSYLGKWRFKPQESKIYLEYPMLNTNVEIEGRSLKVLESDIRRYRVIELEEQPNDQDNKDEWNCWIQRIKIVTQG